VRVADLIHVGLNANAANVARVGLRSPRATRIASALGLARALGLVERNWAAGIFAVAT
jgi:hypothetical protein